MNFLNSLMKELRPYQQKAIDATLSHFSQGIKRQIVNLPTGSGKTVVFSELIRLLPNPTSIATKTLILAHREELLNQAYSQILERNDKYVAIDQANRRANVEDAEIVVASVMTLSRKNGRLDKYDPMRFKCVIIDEAHHSVAESYLTVLDHFGLMKGNSSHILLWGCTATVFRNDGLGLNSVFDKVVYSVSMKEMIEEGYLTKFKVYSLSGRDTNDCQQVVSDFKKLDSENHQFKSILVFCSSIQHVEDMRDAFIEVGETSVDVITTRTKAKDRGLIIDLFRMRGLRILVNCGILTEGTDLPNVDCLLLCRATESDVLYMQMIGRGSRLYENKEVCHIVDFAGNCARNSIEDDPSLEGLDIEFYRSIGDEAPERTFAGNREVGRGVVDERELDIGKHGKKLREWGLFDEKFDGSLVGKTSFRSRYTWSRLIESEDTYIIEITNDRALLVSQKGPKEYIAEMAHKTRIETVPVTSTTLHRTIKACDTIIQKIYENQTQQLVLRKAQWRKEKITAAQLMRIETWVKKKKISPEHLPHVKKFVSELTKGQASDLIKNMKWNGILNDLNYFT